jgi:hypothetical protein
MKVSALKGKERTIPITVPGEDGDPDEIVHITYRPGAVDLEMSDKITEAVLNGVEADVALIMLEPMLVSWELTDDDGLPWPVDVEHLRKTPLQFIGLILEAIQEDSRPNPPRDATSDDGSPQTASSDASPNGTPSSEPQIDSTVPLGNSLSTTDT